MCSQQLAWSRKILRNQDLGFYRRELMREAATQNLQVLHRNLHRLPPLPRRPPGKMLIDVETVTLANHLAVSRPGAHDMRRPSFG
jgi:hypothetical protein